MADQVKTSPTWKKRNSLRRSIVIDTHTHLWSEAEIDQLTWQTPNGPLASQHSVIEYLASVIDYSEIAHPRNTLPASGCRPHSMAGMTPRPCLFGYIFIEAERKSGLLQDQWNEALNEIAFLGRVARGDDEEEEGISPVYINLCKGIIPWAPIPAGRESLELYRKMAFEAAGESASLIKGWRYLIQGKPDGIMLEDGFIHGLQALGEIGESFELGIDFRQRGQVLLLEAVECLKRVYSGVSKDKQVVIIINHMCKPDIHRSQPGVQWSKAIQCLAEFPNVFMKLSGAFSETPKSTDTDLKTVEDIPEPGQPSLPLSKRKPGGRSKAARMAFKNSKNRQQEQVDVRQREIFQIQKDVIHHHMNVVWNAFGPQRCMFGSDWPVCKIGCDDSRGNERDAWAAWMELVEEWALNRGLKNYERELLFHGVATKVYKISMAEWETERTVEFYNGDLRLKREFSDSLLPIL